MSHCIQVGCIIMNVIREVNWIFKPYFKSLPLFWNNNNNLVLVVCVVTLSDRILLNDRPCEFEVGSPTFQRFFSFRLFRERCTG
jgi:hypothetical protein